MQSSFENSRLADLVALHLAIAALGQAPDHAAVDTQEAELSAQLSKLYPTMISRHECLTYRELVVVMADIRRETLSS